MRASARGSEQGSREEADSVYLKKDREMKNLKEINTRKEKVDFSLKYRNNSINYDEEKRMMNRVVVMGGSFNPPTIAHLRLMQTAIEAIGANKGIFAPTPHEYVDRKMKRQKHREDTLSESIRIKMLESFRDRDSRIAVSRVQIQETGCAHDYDMLVAIQRENPDAEIFFVTGSDKLYILPRWREIGDLLMKFRILVARRGEDNLNKIKEDMPYLAEHWDRFTVFDVPADIGMISSSAFRERLHNNDESAAELVTQ